MKLRLRFRSLLILIGLIAVGLGAEVARRRAIESERISSMYEQLEARASFNLHVATRGIEHARSMIKQESGNSRWSKQEEWWRKTFANSKRQAILFEELRVKYHSERFYIWKSLVIPADPEQVPLLIPPDVPIPLEDMQ